MANVSDEWIMRMRRLIKIKKRQIAYLEAHPRNSWVVIGVSINAPPGTLPVELYERFYCRSAGGHT